MKLNMNLPFQSKTHKVWVLLYSAAYRVLGSRSAGLLVFLDLLLFLLQHMVSTGTVFSGLAQTGFLAGPLGDR